MQAELEKRRDARVQGGGLQSRSVRFEGAGLGSLRLGLMLMDNTLLREESLGGRKAWVILSEAKRDATPGSPSETRALYYRHTWWIDQEALVVARHESEVIRQGPDPSDPVIGSRTAEVYATENGSPWLLRTADLWISTRSTSMSGVQTLEQHRFTDYKKFDVQSTIKFEEKEPR